MSKPLPVMMSLCLMTIWLTSLSNGDETRPLTIQEPFGLAWGPDRVNYALEFPEGAVSAQGVGLKDAAGQPVPVQLSAIEFWPDKKTVKKATASFMATLKPDESVTWTLTAGRKSVRQPKTDLEAKEKGGTIELANSKTGIRLVGGTKSFREPSAADKTPAPIQAVRLSDGKWIGKGWWQTDGGCTNYSAAITEEGPVFVQAKLRYNFEGGRHYAATVELASGQDLAVLTEEYDLSDGKRYPMSGVDGMKPDVLYAYVRPFFSSPDKTLIWDWWAQTMAVLPTPNAYCFSFYEGLQPDSADFNGNSRYGNLKPGDGGLTYDKDGRFAYVNGYMQWGDEETLYLGLYNSKTPARQLAVVGLRPSQWLHPDIDPHPNTMLKQYVQTTCLTFERTSTNSVQGGTSGDAFMRAPVCLGKRVYGIGGVERTLGRQVLPERSGPVVTTNDVWGSNLMLRHIRYGSVELDKVRQWVLNYDEPSLYPRMYVPAGDRARYESRRTRKPIEEVQKDLAARKGPTDADRKAVADGQARLRQTVQHFAQVAYGHMDYGINEGLLADAAEEALSSPAVTPEQARDIRRWLAAIVYQALNPDYVPPRTAGFAWGSANMMAQVQCRACYLAALLPNHPAGKAWRDRLAYAVTLYVEDQINEAGATLECPHYGSMAVMMPAHALAALANCGGVDLTRASVRLRAAANHRLATLLPYDVRGGFRPGGVEGDGYYEGDATLAPLAGFFQTNDVPLAKNLAWGVKESNNTLGGHSDPSYKLFDPGLEPVAPAFGSEYFAGFGFVMRNGFPRQDEAFVMVYADSFSWGHGHTDRGTWVMYAKGAPLMIDFAAMYTPSMREQWLHPGGLSFNHDETVRPAGNDPKDDWWRRQPSYSDLKTAPFTVVEMRADPDAKGDLETFGTVTAFRSLPQADYAEMQRRIRYLHRVAYALPEPHGKMIFDDGAPHEEVWLKQPFTWTRRFVFVRDADPAGHNYLVIRDDLPGNTELDPYLNLWCLADKLDVNSQVAIYTGQHGVNLHCYVAEPVKFAPKTRTVGHPCGFGFSGYYKKTFGKDFREDMIQFQIPQSKKDGGYFAAMVPVKQGEPAPKFETILDGRAIRVTFPDRTDTILLRNETAEITVDGKPVTGASALVTTAGGQSTVTALRGE